MVDTLYEAYEFAVVLASFLLVSGFILFGMVFLWGFLVEAVKLTKEK